MGMQVKRASFLVETVAFLAIVIFALIAMQKYIKRSFMGKYRELADSMSQSQYDPQASNINSTITTSSVSGEYMLYDDVDGDGDYEYVGTAVLAEANTDVSSVESTGNIDISGGSSTAGSSGWSWF
jgi:hypothetical protein